MALELEASNAKIAERLAKLTATRARTEEAIAREEVRAQIVQR